MTHNISSLFLDLLNKRSVGIPFDLTHNLPPLRSNYSVTSPERIEQDQYGEGIEHVYSEKVILSS